MEENKVTSDKILSWAISQVEGKKSISRELWLEIAFRLNLLRIEESQLVNKMRQEVAKKKLELFRAQEKRNVSAVELEVEATDEYRFLKDQEDKIYSIDEFVRIAKKNSDTAY